MYVWCPQDVDEFFQTEREHNHVLTGCSKSAAEVNLEAAVGLAGQRGAFGISNPRPLLLFPAEIAGRGAN